MSSAIAICNQAVISLGGQEITSLDDDVVEAKLCKSLYLPVLNALIEEHSWSFATKWYSIPKLATAPEGEFANAYPIPVDVGRIMFVGTDYKHPSREWRVENGNIVTNDNTCKIQAVFAQEDPSTFSASFIQALVSRLSAELAIPLTGSRTAMESHYKLYQVKLKSAITADGLQGSSRRVTSSWLRNARYGGYIGAGPTV